MKKLTIAVFLISAVVLSGCSLGQEPTPTPEAQVPFIPVVSVTGELLPETWATLGHKTGGTVAEVFVQPGDAVTAGEVLARMDTTDLEIALEVARQSAVALEAARDQLLAGATDQVIARADRENAQQIDQAEVALKATQRRLEQARAYDPAEDVAAAQARIRRIESQLAQARAQNPAPEARAAQVELERAKIALDDAQNEYTKALDRPWEDQEIRDALFDQLEQAQLNYRSAQAQLDSAWNAQRAHTLSLDALEAQLEEAQVMLEQALDAQEAHEAQLRVLETEIEAAELQIEHLRAWENPYRDAATEEEIAQAEARVEQAEWQIAQIEQQIQDAEVRAPFDGTVGLVDVRPGEFVAPAQPLFTVGDLGTLRVETTDLDEIDVVRVALDQPVSVTFDALPDVVYPGRVTRISPMAEPGSGGVHYTVIVELDEPDPILRWGMTAFVDIETEE
jgi:HlyD family secretion protein